MCPNQQAKKKKPLELLTVLRKMRRHINAPSTRVFGHATSQPNPNTMKKVKQLLDYAATYPDAIVTYNASDMVLAAHSNASYLSESNARSRAGGHFFMSSDTETPHNDGAWLSSTCRMSACRFFAQTATFCVVSATCCRHVSVMSQTQENVVSARVSKRHDI